MHTDRILAIDVGGGTQDVLLYDAAQPSMEDCIQLVLPAQTQVVAGRIRAATATGRAVFLTGNLMGGGACASALKRHVKAGLAAYATPRAALTIRDNLDEVRARGVQIVDALPDPTAVTIHTDDLDLPSLRAALAPYDVTLPQTIAVAVQDHGECLQGSNREVRFATWREFVERGGALLDLLYPEPPAGFTRMRAIQVSAPGAILMDTAAAAIWGAFCDPAVAAQRERGLIVLNVGNQHILGALVRGERIYGLFEHHTVLVDAARLASLVAELHAGTLSNEALLAEHGHGATILPDYRPWRSEPWIAVTGPRRAMAAGIGAYEAAPFGNMMLAGAFGLVAAVQRYAGGR